MVERLRIHAVAGRLDTDELAVRAEAAYRARTVEDLASLVFDLPSKGHRVAAAARPRRLTWRLPAVGTICGAGTTVVVAHFDGGFRGAFDGVAAVPFWATLALGGLSAAAYVAARVRTVVPSRARDAT